MEPNNNQPINNTNPLGQPTVAQPVVTPPLTTPPAQQFTPPPTPAPVMPIPKAPGNNNKKGIILIMILVILTAGMGYYVFFAKNQLNTAQKALSENKSIVIPTAIVPTAAPVTLDNIQIGSPEAELTELEKDMQGL